MPFGSKKDPKTGIKVDFYGVFERGIAPAIAGGATIDASEEARRVEHAATMGDAIVSDLRPLIDEFEFVKDVRGKGMMLAIEFTPLSCFRKWMRLRITIGTRKIASA